MMPPFRPDLAERISRAAGFVALMAIAFIHGAMVASAILFAVRFFSEITK